MVDAGSVDWLAPPAPIVSVAFRLAFIPPAEVSGIALMTLGCTVTVRIGLSIEDVPSTNSASGNIGRSKVMVVVLAVLAGRKTKRATAVSARERDFITYWTHMRGRRGRFFVAVKQYSA